MQPFHEATATLLERLAQLADAGDLPVGVDTAGKRLGIDVLRRELYERADLRSTSALLGDDHFYLVALRSLCAAYLMQTGDALALLDRAARSLAREEPTVETARRAVIATVFEHFALKLDQVELEAFKVPPSLAAHPRLEDALQLFDQARVFAFASRGRWQDAAELLEQTLERQVGADRAIVLAWLAACRWNIGDDAAAVEAFRASRSTDTRRSPNLYRLTALTAQLALATLKGGVAVSTLRRELRAIRCRKVGLRAFERRVGRIVEVSRERGVLAI